MEITTDIKGRRYYIDVKQKNHLYEIGYVLNDNRIISYVQIIRKSSESGNDVKTIGYLVECVFDGCQFVITQADFMRMHACPICKNKFKYNVGDIINNTQILECYKKNNKKYYSCKCLIDNYIFEAKESTIREDQHRCPLCHGVLIPDVNDIATLRPDLIIYFEDASLPKKLTLYSNKTVELKCPICGKLKKMKVETLSIQGFSCPNCSDGISLPNKYMSLLLSSINIKFDTEVKFDWCCFEKYQNSNELYSGRYDFVLRDYSIIIEMDGEFHFEQSNLTAKDLSEIEYTDRMKDSLAENNGYKVIRINSCISKCKTEESIKILRNNILSSELNTYFDFTSIDFNEVYYKALQTNYNVAIINMWNEGKSVGEISLKTHCSKSKVYAVLKFGNSINLCDYTYEESVKRGLIEIGLYYEYMIYKNDVLQYIAHSVQEVSIYLLQNEANKISFKKENIARRISKKDEIIIDNFVIKKQNHTPDKTSCLV